MCEVAPGKQLIARLGTDGDDAGAIEYQVCDEKICYNPTRIPISFTLPVKPLDRPLPR